MIRTRLSSALSSAVLGCAQARITNLLMNGLSHPLGTSRCLVHKSAISIFLSEKVPTGPTRMKGASYVLFLTPLSTVEASSSGGIGRLDLVADLKQIVIVLASLKLENARVQKEHPVTKATLLSVFPLL